jgi:hypothetical protein
MEVVTGGDKDRELGDLVAGFRRRKDTDLAGAAMASAGDVSKVEGYQNLAKCLSQLSSIEAGSGGGSMGAGLRAACDGHAQLVRHRDGFRKVFAPGGAESAKYIYAGAVMALWATTTMLCGEAVVYRPSGGSGLLMPGVDERGAAAVAASMPAVRLAGFAAAASSANFDRALGAMASVEKEALGEASFWSAAGFAAAAGVASQIGATTALGASFGPVGAFAGVGLGLVLACLYGARDIAAYAYEKRTSMASWLQLQAGFLEMNAAALSPGMGETRQKQMEYAARLRQMADRIRVDLSAAQSDADRILRGEAETLRHGSPGAGAVLV